MKKYGNILQLIYKIKNKFRFLSLIEIVDRTYNKIRLLTHNFNNL